MKLRTRKKIVEGIITEIYAGHRQRSLSRRYPSLTLWARTDNGDEVWLGTGYNDSRTAEYRMKMLKEQNQHLIGKIIRYDLKSNPWTLAERGFLRRDSEGIEVKLDIPYKTERRIENGTTRC